MGKLIWLWVVSFGVGFAAEAKVIVPELPEKPPGVFELSALQQEWQESSLEILGALGSLKEKFEGYARRFSHIAENALREGRISQAILYRNLAKKILSQGNKLYPDPIFHLFSEGHGIDALFTTMLKDFRDWAERFRNAKPGELDALRLARENSYAAYAKIYREYAKAAAEVEAWWLNPNGEWKSDDEVLAEFTAIRVPLFSESETGTDPVTLDADAEKLVVQDGKLSFLFLNLGSSSPKDGPVTGGLNALENAEIVGKILQGGTKAQPLHIVTVPPKRWGETLTPVYDANAHKLTIRYNPSPGIVAQVKEPKPSVSPARQCLQALLGQPITDRGSWE